MEAERPNDGPYYTGAGFELWSPKSETTNIGLATDLLLKPTVTKGKVLFSFTFPDKKVIAEVMYREVGTETWIRVALTTHAAFAIDNLPSRMMVQFRVAVSGAGVNNTSDWVLSNEVEVY